MKTFVTAALVVGILALSCGMPPATLLSGAQLAAGGSFDVSTCSFTSPLPTFLLTPRNDGTSVGLAVCGQLDGDNTVTIDGDVRVLEETNISSPLNVTGSLYAARDVHSTNTINVTGNFSTQRNWVLNAPAHVGGDATIQGTLVHNNTLSVAGTLRAAQETGNGAITAGTTIIAASTVADPLRCQDAPDAHGLVNQVERNESRTLGNDALSNVRQPTELTLGCGRYVLSDVRVSNNLKLRIVGPTVLVIRGKMEIKAPTVIEIANGGALELVIDDDLNVENNLTIGDSAHSALVVVAEHLRVSAPLSIFGALIGPRAELDASNTVTVEGGMIVGDAHISSPLVVRNGLTLSASGWPTAPR